MNYYGKAESVASKIMAAFKSPEKLPAAIAPCFIDIPGSETPCRAWSWMNQLIVALDGHSDARGFKQWKGVNRSVMKGETASHILIPLIRKRKDEKTGEERGFLYGFKSAAVFGYDQTEGEELPGRDESKALVEALPLIDVAEQWGVSVACFNGRGAGFLGRFTHSENIATGETRGAIALGVENLSTWCHELCHVADCRNGKLTKRAGQQLDNETVAEFGGAILLQLLGKEHDADLGGCFSYLEGYAKAEGKDVVGVCTQFLNRTCEAVKLILETSKVSPFELAA